MNPRSVAHQTQWHKFLADSLSRRSVCWCADVLCCCVLSFLQGLTVYLGSVLYQMGDFCILCVSTYVINWALLVTAIRELRAKYAPQRSGKAVRRTPAPDGGRAAYVLGVAGTLAAVWASLLVGVGGHSWIPAPAFAVLQTLPLWALVSFGAYSLASIGIALCTFRDCPQAFVELEKDIADARVRLQRRGFKADQATKDE